MKAGAADYLAKDELNPTLLERSIRYAMRTGTKRRHSAGAQRVIQALSECNDAVIEIKDEHELLGEICRIAVGGWRHRRPGWDISRIMTDHSQPVAKYGYRRLSRNGEVDLSDSRAGKRPMVKQSEPVFPPYYVRLTPPLPSKHGWQRPSSAAMYRSSAFLSMQRTGSWGRLASSHPMLTLLTRTKSNSF